jgi:hypothetical protein
LRNTTPAGGHRPANNHLGAGIADAAQLRNEIGVARCKRLENRFQVAFLGDDLELLGRALAEAAGVGEQGDLLEPLLVEIVGGALQDQIIVDRALEHETALGNRIDDGAGTLGGDERNLRGFRHRRDGERDAAHVATAHDHLDAVIAQEAARLGDRLLGLALRVIEDPLYLATADAAGIVDLIDGQLGAVLHVLAEEGRRPAYRQNGADADGIGGASAQASPSGGCGPEQSRDGRSARKHHASPLIDLMRAARSNLAIEIMDKGVNA